MPRSPLTRSPGPLGPLGLTAALLLAGAPLSAQRTAAAPAPRDTLRFTPTVGHPTFAVREPVRRIRPGTLLISRTMFGPYYTEQGGAFPGEVGPFYVEGATPDDMLVVRIRKLRPNWGLAAAQLYTDFGGLATSSRVRMLNEPTPARRYIWRLDTARMTATTTLPDSRLRNAARARGIRARLCGFC